MSTLDMIGIQGGSFKSFLRDTGRFIKKADRTLRRIKPATIASKVIASTPGAREALASNPYGSVALMGIEKARSAGYGRKRRRRTSGKGCRRCGSKSSRRTRR